MSVPRPFAPSVVEPRKKTAARFASPPTAAGKTVFLTPCAAPTSLTLVHERPRSRETATRERPSPSA
jgi:hypothetical protein